MLSLPDIRRPFLLLLLLLLPFSTCPVAVGDLPLIWARVAGFVQGRKFKLCATLWHFHNFAYETWLWLQRVSRYRCALCHVFRIIFYSALFFILLCCCDRCSLLLPLMQNFNFNLIPVVALVVRIVCQLFPSSQPVFGNKNARAINLAQIFVGPPGKRWVNMAATWLCYSLSSLRWIVCIALKRRRERVGWERGRGEEGGPPISFTTLICWHWTLEACTEICNLPKGN